MLNWNNIFAGLVSEVHTDAITLHAFASDASFYRLLPQAVVRPHNEAEVLQVLRACREHRTGVTFRAAGTSLSGQSVGSGVMVDIMPHWLGVEILDQGKRVKVKPGTRGGYVNACLAGYGYQIGPDPASIDACAIGGIIANNSSGMCCGVKHNAFHTVESMTFILPNGVRINTADPNAEQQFWNEAREVAQCLKDLRAKILADENLLNKITSAYELKNTVGYSLNALTIPGENVRMVDIMAKLLVGSEGTLGFISEAIFNCIPILPKRYTGLLLFRTLKEAAAAVSPLRDSGAVAVEMMDSASIASIQRNPKIGNDIQNFFTNSPSGAACLLVEYGAKDSEGLAQFKSRSTDALGQLSLFKDALFTEEAKLRAAIWLVRKGLYPSVGAARLSGRPVIIEDVVFKPEDLAEATADLQDLFAKYGYKEAVIFGHALDGNYHFVITPDLNQAEERKIYEDSIRELVSLVVQKYNGHLKGEHGTGRNMAPFVETEWGSDCYQIMLAIKRAVDPDYILNPGVIFNEDPHCFVTDINPMTRTSEIADHCTGCGFCERACPSREVTLTPRKRILLSREINALRNSGEDPQLLIQLESAFEYQGVATCAADGMCATACPVGIDTGKLMKEFRAQNHGWLAKALANNAEAYFWLTELVAKNSLRAGHMLASLIGNKGLAAITRSLDSMLGGGVPKWSAQMLLPAGRLPLAQASNAEYVYYPSCVTRNMCAAKLSTPQAIISLAQRAGIGIKIPQNVHGTCCGTPFSSKGFVSAYKSAASRLFEACWQWSEQGRLPIIVDNSPCTYGMLNWRDALNQEQQARYQKLRIIDAVEFAANVLAPKLRITPISGQLAFHPVCSLQKMGLTDPAISLLKLCAEGVFVPPSTGCCGMAGDRGFIYPELTASATKQQAQEVRAASCACHVSSSLTCEHAMSVAVGEQYQGILQLLERVTS